MKPLSHLDRLFVWLIFIHYLVFELVFFYGEAARDSGLAIVITGWKTMFPLALLLYTGFPPRQFFDRQPSVGWYTTLFGLLMAWAVVPCLLSDYPGTSILSWFKLVPRGIFYLGILSFFAARPAAFAVLAKLIVSFCAVTVAQYILLVLTGSQNRSTYLPGMGAILFAGPFGVLGNVTSLLQYASLPFAIPRLCGFWQEPSNAASSMFVSFFLARYLRSTGYRKFWTILGWACFCGGLLCLSNAGYIAISAAAAFGSFFRKSKSITDYAAKALIFLAVAVFAVVALFGRSYVAKNMPDNAIACALVGVRTDRESATSDEYDPSSGRILLMEAALEQVKQRIWGIGVLPGGDGGPYAMLSASAPIAWFTCTGVLGLALLMAREAVLLRAGIRYAKLSKGARFLVQAWIVILVQQASYGLWMDPLYFIGATGVSIVAPQALAHIADRRERMRGFAGRGRVPVGAWSALGNGPA